MPNETPDRTFQTFMNAAEDLLNGTAASKGYSPNGPDGSNPLYAFVEHAVGGSQHAIGEIIYKAVRYQHQRDPKDLLKIAAWAYLVWRHHEA